MDAALMLLGAPVPDALDPGFHCTGTALDSGFHCTGTALDSGFHCVRTQWVRGFMAFRLAQRTRTVMLMVPVCPESGFLSEDGRYVMSRGADRSKRGKAEPCRCC